MTSTNTHTHAYTKNCRYFFSRAQCLCDLFLVLKKILNIYYVNDGGKRERDLV